MLSVLRSMPLLVIALCFILVAQVQAKPEKGKTYKDWTVVCETLPEIKKKVCNIFQNVTNDEGKVVMQVAIGYPPGQTIAQALITLPLGVILPPGIEFSVGTVKPVRVPYSVCLKNGCVAVMQLSNELITTMKNGTKGTIKIIASKKKGVAIPVSLSGFTAGFNSLKK